MSNIARALSIVEDNGERDCEAELHRLNGLLQLHANDRRGARQSLERAVTVASDQGAHFLGLRASRDLAQLYALGGEAAKGLDLLRQSLGAMKEGHGSLDFKEAEALCSSLPEHGAE